MLEPEAPDIAVMARLDAAGGLLLLPIELDQRHTPPERTVTVDRGGVGIGQDQRRMRRTGARRPRDRCGERPPRPVAAAIDDHAIGTITKLEAQRRRAPT